MVKFIGALTLAKLVRQRQMGGARPRRHASAVALLRGCLQECGQQRPQVGLRLKLGCEFSANGNGDPVDVTLGLDNCGVRQGRVGGRWLISAPRSPSVPVLTASPIPSGAA
jgi:hypothetical protein